MVRNCKKDAFFKMRLTTGELFQVTMLAQSKGLSNSAYVRRCALRHPLSKVHPEVAKGMVVIAGVLDQVWKELESGNFRPEDTLKCLGQIVELLKHLKDLARPADTALPARVDNKASHEDQSQ